MPLTQLDIDDAISQGVSQGQTMYNEVRADMMKPYDEARKKAEWYALLEQMAPGMPGAMVEKSLEKTDPAQLKRIKEVFMKGGQNGTVRGQ